MSSDKKDNLPIVHSAEDLSITFPEPIEQIKKEGKKTRQLIQKNSSYTPDGRTWINRKNISHLLSTDSKGGRRVYNDLDEDDKLKNGTNDYASVEAVQKETSKRIQEPRDTIQKERLKDTEECLKALRDAPELEKIRELEESKIRKELPAVKRKKLKVESVDCITGEALIDPEVHHKDRVADKPRRALDEENLVALNKNTHRDQIHGNGIESEKEFEDYKNKKANK